MAKLEISQKPGIEIEQMMLETIFVITILLHNTLRIRIKGVGVYKVNEFVTLKIKYQLYKSYT